MSQIWTHSPILQTQLKNQYTLGPEDHIKAQISNLLIESDTDDCKREEDYVNQLKNDDISSSFQTTSDEDEKEGPTVSVLIRDQNLLLDIVENIFETEKRQLYLNKFKECLNQISASSNPLTKDLRFLKTYNLTNTLDRFPSKPTKPLTLQNVQIEIDLLKKDVRAIKTKQKLNSLVLQNLVTVKEPINPNT